MADIENNKDDEFTQFKSMRETLGKFNPCPTKKAECLYEEGKEVRRNLMLMIWIHLAAIIIECTMFYFVLSMVITEICFLWLVFVCYMTLN